MRSRLTPVLLPATVGHFSAAIDISHFVSKVTAEVCNVDGTAKVAITSSDSFEIWSSQPGYAGGATACEGSFQLDKAAGSRAMIQLKDSPLPTYVSLKRTAGSTASIYVQLSGDVGLSGTNKNKTITNVPADAAANTASEFVLLDTTSPLVCRTISIRPLAAVVADAADFASFILKIYDSDGNVVNANYRTKTTEIAGADALGSLTQRRKYTLSSSGPELPAGQSLHLAVTKSGAGVQLPEYEITVEYEQDQAA
jgi:hypothetical protein